MTINPYVNGSSYAPPRERDHVNGYETARDAQDDSMDQIRDLILGDLRRHWDARLQTLETRLQMLEDKVDALKHEHKTARQDHISALAAGIDDLGQHIRSLSRS
jgi:CHASE3 domain sensor protein